MENSLSPSAKRVQDALQKSGASLTVVELPHTTRTSKEAAQSIGCTVEQIAKSIIFRGKNSGNPVLVIASGVNRVDERKIAALIGEPVEKPDAAYVQEKTGF
ncbi:MAG TPA: YbaK/EbsC family protein, partial [Anaerolineaceae bacterium]|nr:YbaK/EbsC family protein [Anaerolineaceae bacterium]